MYYIGIVVVVVVAKVRYHGTCGDSLHANTSRFIPRFVPSILIALPVPRHVQLQCQPRTWGSLRHREASRILSKLLAAC